jgi:hypothetical protein
MFYAGGGDDGHCALELCVRRVLAIFDDDEHNMFTCSSDTLGCISTY